jgi:hypothetical protein
MINEPKQESESTLEEFDAPLHDGWVYVGGCYWTKEEVDQHLDENLEFEDNND